MDRPPPSTVDRLRRLAFPARLSAVDAERLEAERVEANRTRTAGVLPVLVVVHVAMLFVFRSPPGALHAEFRAGVFWIHLLCLPASATLSALAWLAPRRKWRVRWLGDAVLILAVGFGLALTLNTHRLLPNLNGLVIALFSGTLVVRPARWGSVVAYGGAAVGLAIGIDVMQPDAELRLASLSTGITAIVLTFAFSRVLDAAFARDVTQRLTIARQKSELEAWTAELERRVEAQVVEALARADEVKALDAQLRWKVRERSRELARALRTAEGESELAPGARFEHRFEIDRIIGEGAMGDVYAGRDQATGQTVAIKILRRWEGMAPSDLKRFVAEAAAAASVVHPAIVRTFHVDVSERGQLYQIMELVPGHTLAHELLRGRYDAAQAARLGAVVAEALAAAHAAGVVHRDIKPSNLMLCSAPPGVKVLDFGVSKLVDDEHVGATIAGQVVGTPLYMAPEQILRAREVTGACDVYALGQVLYEMLTGEPSFAGRTVGEVLRAHVADAPMSVRSRAGHVPDDLAGVLAQCLQKSPEARPSAEALAAALRVLADSQGAPPAERIGPPHFPRNRLAGMVEADATMQGDGARVEHRQG